ncbi:MAG: hypothetical protein AAGI01_18690, partial [Myxococcota bacterium]
EKPMVRAMGDREPTRANVATWASGALNTRAVRAALEEELERGQNGQRKALAALSLGRIGDASSYGVLERALQTEALRRYTNDVTLTAAWSLGVLADTRAAGQLADVLRRGPPDASLMAAWSLGRLSSASQPALGSLLDAYWSGDDALRERARVGLSVALSKPKPGLTEAEVHHAMQREERFVKHGIRDARFDVTGLLKHVLDGVRTPPMVDPTEWMVEHEAAVRAAIKRALDAGSPASSGVMLEDLARADASLALGSPGVAGQVRRREALSGALGEVREVLLGAMSASGDKQSVQTARERFVVIAGVLGRAQDLAALGELSGAESARTRRLVVRALGVGYPASAQAADAVRAGLSDPSFDVRLAALEQVSRIEGAQGLVGEVLRVLERDAVSAVRQSAARALGELGDAGALGALERAARGADLALGVDALRSIRRIGGAEADRILAGFTKHPDLRMRVAARGR